MTGDHIDRQMELTMEPWRLDQLVNFDAAEPVSGVANGRRRSAVLI